MNRIFIKTVVLCCAIIFSFNIKAVNLYWIGGTGNWNDPTHWSTTSGGTAGAVIPTAADNVFFNASSFTGSGQAVTINAMSYCNSMSWTGVLFNPNFAHSAQLNIYGSLTMSPNMTVSGGASTWFTSTNTGNTIFSAGKSIPGEVYFNGVGGAWTILDAFSCLDYMWFYNGTLNTNNQDFTVKLVTCPGSGVRVLNLGSSHVYITGAGCYFDASDPTVTLNSGTSTIEFTNTAAPYLTPGLKTYNNILFSHPAGGGTIYGNSAVYNDVTFVGPGTIGSSTTFYCSSVDFQSDGTITGGGGGFGKVSIAGNGIISGNQNYDTLLFAAGKTYAISAAATQTINNYFEANGSCGQPITIKSYSTGSPTSIAILGAANINYAQIKDITATGAFVANNSIDLGGNTGLTINSPASQNLYWVNGLGNWNDPNHWALTSGGIGGTCIPTRYDNVFFNANSFSAGNKTVTINIAAECKNMNWTGATQTPILTGTSDLNIYGSLTFISAMTNSFTGKVYFKSTGSGNTITSAGKSFSNAVYFDGAGADWTLNDAFSVTGTSGVLHLDYGYLVTNDNALSFYYFQSFGANARGLYLGNSTITITGLDPSNYTWYVSGTNFSVDAGTSTINVLSLGSPTFFGGVGNLYNKVSFQDLNTQSTIGGGGNYNNVIFNGDALITTSVSSYGKVVFMKSSAISDNNVFDTLQIVGNNTCTIGYGKILTIGKLITGGSCSQPATILSSSAGSQATINATLPIVASYLSLKDINRTGSSFIANNSQDLGNNTGITINAPLSQNLYWVGGSGNWNDAAHWSLTQGGAGGACVPTSADNVFFTTGSFTIGSKILTMNVAANCKNMSWTGAQFTPVITGSADLNSYGSLTLITGMNFTGYTGKVYFKSTTTGNAITSAGRVFNNHVYFDGTGSWLLQDALNTGTYSLNHVKGMLNTNGKTVTTAIFNCNSTNNRQLILGSSSLNIVNSTATQNILNFGNTSSLILNSGTSTINFTSTGGSYPNFNAGTNLNFYDVNIIQASPAVQFMSDMSNVNTTFHNFTGFIGVNSIFYGTASFNKFDVRGLQNSFALSSFTMDSLFVASGSTNLFGQSCSLIINDFFSADGTSGDLTEFYYGNPSYTYTISKPSCILCLNYADIKGCNAIGGANFYAANSTNGGNNTGWNFASCPSNTLTVGPIVGKATPCNNSTGNVYSIPAISGANYFWSVPAGSGISSGQGSASIVVTSGTLSGNISVTVTACGTSSVVSKAITPQALPVINNINVTNATCSNNDGSLTATVSGGNAPYDYQWSSGDSLATAPNLFSGQYLLQVTDNNGCKVSGTANVNASNGPSVTVVSTTPASCNGGSNGAVTVSVTGGTAPYTANWSNGSTALSVTGLAAGPYDLTINDSINCVVVKTINITQPTAITNSFTSNPSACAGATGDATAFPSGGTGVYTYTWSSNAANQTSATASNLASGVYTVTIKDANNCILTDVAVVNNVASTLTSTIGNIVAGDCSLNSPGSLTMNATGGVGTYTYQWSNGSTNATVSGLFPGTYFCVVTDASLCSSVKSATVPSNIGTILQSLCMVTVDTTSANPSNLIIWEKTTTHDIKSFKIYRETSSQNVYQAIATVPYNALSEYNDAVANPAVHSWRYKITAIDSCDNETAYSLTHKTIHLTQNLGVGATINLAWDYYDGFVYTTYYIWRHDPSTNWVLLDSLSTNYTAYTDFAPPSVNSRYMIEVRPPGACNSSAFKPDGVTGVQAQVVKSKSNIRNNFTTNIITGLSASGYMSSYVRVYPNPAANLLHIDLLLKNGNANIYIVNILGQSVYSTVTSLPANIIDISPLETGVYTVKVITEKGQAVQKIVVE